MTSRERMLAALNHQEADRVPVIDVVWPTTVARWHEEGLPADASPTGFFGYEWGPLSADFSFRFEVETLEETDRHRIVKDDFGATTRTLVDQESVPEPIDFTITSRELWEEHKPRMAWDDSRVDWGAARAHREMVREAGLFLVYQAGFGYDLVMRFAGAARVLEAMATDPSWVKDMIDTVADSVIAGGEAMIAKGIDFDGAFLWNDMAYRNGPFFSPAMYRELEFPAQQRLCDFFHGHNMPVVLHTDGDVRPLVPMFIEAGFDCLQPLEVKAGMDLIALKQEYGDRLAFMGGIDTRAMADPDPRAIEDEIRSKVTVAKQGGGYIYHSDHSVPDNVSFQQYCRVMELVGEHGSYR